VLVAVVALEGCTKTPRVRSDLQSPTLLAQEGQLDRAKEILAREDDQDIVEFFSSWSLVSPPLELEAREFFLLGRAYFNTARNEIELSRRRGPAGMGSLSQRSVDMLKFARNSLLAAGDKEPGGGFAPESLYLAGRCSDHGFLQDFQGAMEIYRWAARVYPNSEFGEKAEKRYRTLLDKSGGVYGSSPGD